MGIGIRREVLTLDDFARVGADFGCVARWVERRGLRAASVETRWVLGVCRTPMEAAVILAASGGDGHGASPVYGDQALTGSGECGFHCGHGATLFGIGGCPDPDQGSGGGVAYGWSGGGAGVYGDARADGSGHGDGVYCRGVLSMEPGGFLR